LAEGIVACPAQQTAPIVPGRSTVQFAAETCRVCAVRDGCLSALT